MLKDASISGGVISGIKHSHALCGIREQQQIFSTVVFQMPLQKSPVYKVPGQHA